jgi:DNA-binding response OmpR family regulator
MQEKKNVIIVEDEKSLMMILEKLFESNGFDVIKANDGLEAINLLNSKTPDIMILDLMLPKLSGFKLLDIIREDTGLSDIPVIVLSARADRENRELALSLGAKRFIEKPFSPFQLLDEVKKIIF